MNRCVPSLVAILVLVTAGSAAQAGREADRLYEEAVRRHSDSMPAERFARYARAAEAGCVPLRLQAVYSTPRAAISASKGRETLRRWMIASSTERASLRRPR